MTYGKLAAGACAIVIAAALNAQAQGTPQQEPRTQEPQQGPRTQEPQQGPRSQEPQQGTRTQGAQQGTRPAGTDDSQTFVNEMAVAGMAEVELGTLAAQRAQNADVKAFGQMMVKDHTQANAELTKIARQMKADVPTQLDMKHRDLKDRLSKLTGAEFDREYMMAMVAGHEEVAAKLKAKGSPALSTSAGRGGEPVATTGSQSDGALTQWASKTLPTVQQHLERARSIQQKVR